MELLTEMAFLRTCKTQCASKYIYFSILTGTWTVIAVYYILIGWNQNIAICVNTTEMTERPSQFSLFQNSERNKNQIQECQSCSRKVPNYIIQYGPARTATTLQFHILCLFMAMLHEDEKKSVGCYYQKKQKNRSPSSKYTVIKTHDVAKFLRTVPSNSWIFLTSSDALSPESLHLFNLNKQKIKEHNFTIPYVADVSLVSKRGHFIAYEYQSIFGLSDEKMQHIVEYIRYWDILRLCCGKQMSADWRNHLSPSPNYTSHHEPHSSTYPACEMYNISKVEKNLLNTYIVKKFKDIVSLRNFIGKPSLADGNLNGNYCERCNENIAQRHLKINDKCV